MWMLRCANPSESHFKPVVSSDLRRIIRLGETAPLVASQCKTKRSEHVKLSVIKLVNVQKSFPLMTDCKVPFSI